MINDLKDLHSSCGLHKNGWNSLPCTFKLAVLTEKELRLRKVHHDMIGEADLCKEYNKMQTLYYQGRLAEVGLTTVDYAEWKASNYWCQKLARAAKHWRSTGDAWNDAHVRTLCALAVDTRSPLTRLITDSKTGVGSRRSYSAAVTIKELKQFCRENKMKGHSKHTKKQALQAFILHYPLD